MRRSKFVGTGTGASIGFGAVEVMGTPETIDNIRDIARHDVGPVEKIVGFSEHRSALRAT